jgi:hypothetical protein
MEEDHSNMATNTLVPVPESAAAKKPELAVALILRCDNPWVLDNRDGRVKCVPIRPKTGVLNLIVLLLRLAHRHVKH